MPPEPETLPTLSTPRLVLRPSRLEDAPDVARLADDPGVARMTTSIPYPLPPGAAEAFLERMAKADLAREALFALDTVDDEFIGLLGFHPNDDDAAEIGYWLGRPYWGRGYMTEAVIAAMAWAGGEWSRRFVVAGHFADNPTSGQVLIKAGFLYTGEVVRRFSLARGEAAPTRMMVWLA